MYILGRQSGESGKSRQRNGYRKVQRKRYRKVSVEKKIDMQIEHTEIDERKNV